MQTFTPSVSECGLIISRGGVLMDSTSVAGGIAFNKREKIDLDWVIPNFFSKVKRKKCQWLDSPSVSFSNCNWKLSLNIDYLRNGKGLMIDIWMEPPFSDNKTICWSFSMKKSDGSVEKSRTGTCTFRENLQCMRHCMESLDLKYLRKSKLVQSGILTITCNMQDFQVVSQSTQTSELDVPHPVKMESQSSQTSEELHVLHSTKLELQPSESTADTETLARDFKSLLLSGDASDAIIQVKGQTFKVHRAILGSRTPVFFAMFKHKTTESASGIVDIEDSEPETIQRFLQYVYSGAVEDLDPENAIDLYEVADKYQIEQLKQKCLGCIKSGLSVETFCKAISMAMKHDERELTTLATDFFINNIKKIIRTSKWKNYMYENHIEANELLVKTIDPE